MLAKDFMLRMKDRRAKMKGKKEFKQAAFGYMGLKLIILILTYLFISCNNCGEYTHFIRQGIHLFLFSHFIFAGMRICSSILALICFIRGAAYCINFFFKTTYLLSLPYTATTLSLLKEEGAGNWVFLINGILTISIALMITRALRAKYRSSSKIIEPAEPCESEIRLTNA